MTRQTGFALSGVVLWVLVAEPLLADNGPEPIRLQYSGAAAATEIDLDDDGTPGILGLGRGRSSFGPITSHSFLETVFSGFGGNCGETEIENLLVAASNVVQRQADGIYLRATEGFLCADAGFTTLTLSFTESIVGGTGRFAGASGEVLTQCTGVILAVDFVASGARVAHAAFQCESEGEILLP